MFKIRTFRTCFYKLLYIPHQDHSEIILPLNAVIICKNITGCKIFSQMDKPFENYGSNTPIEIWGIGSIFRDVTLLNHSKGEGIIISN